MCLLNPLHVAFRTYWWYSKMSLNTVKYNTILNSVWQRRIDDISEEFNSQSICQTSTVWFQCLVESHIMATAMAAWESLEWLIIHAVFKVNLFIYFNTSGNWEGAVIREWVRSHTPPVSCFIYQYEFQVNWYIDGLIQERRNSIANALELRLSCTSPSTCISIRVLFEIKIHCQWYLMSHVHAIVFHFLFPDIIPFGDTAWKYKAIIIILTPVAGSIGCYSQGTAMK